LFALFEPRRVSPLVRFEIGDDGAGVGTKFSTKGIGIGFERQKITVRAEDFVFVDGAFGDFREKEFPDTGGAARAHRMDAAVPLIHVANDADALCGRGPDGEVRSGDANNRMEMRAEFLVGVKVAAFANEVEVKVGEEKGEGVGIENFEGFAMVGAALDFVAAWFGRGGLVRGPSGFEEAFGAEFCSVGDFGGRDGRIFEDDAGFGGPREEKTDGPAARDGMRAKDAEGIGVLSGEEVVDSCVKFGAPLSLGGRSERCG